MKEKKRPATIILNILIVIATVILALFILVAALAFREDMGPSYKPDESQLIYYLKDQNYSRLVYGASRDRATGNETPGFHEYWAVADYYEASVLYHAYKDNGDTENSARFEQKMKIAESEMGSLSAEKTRIDKLF